MADVHDVLLFWFDIVGLCFPPLFLVSLPLFDLSKIKSKDLSAD